MNDLGVSPPAFAGGAGAASGLPPAGRFAAGFATLRLPNAKHEE